MNKSAWQDKLEACERSELEEVRLAKNLTTDNYRAVYRKLKARCDARIRRETKPLINDGMTPTTKIALLGMVDAPTHCHALTPYARGRLAKLGFAQKIMMSAPFGENGVLVQQLHYEITTEGRNYIANIKGSENDGKK